MIRFFFIVYAARVTRSVLITVVASVFLTSPNPLQFPSRCFLSEHRRKVHSYTNIIIEVINIWPLVFLIGL